MKAKAGRAHLACLIHLKLRQGEHISHIFHAGVWKAKLGKAHFPLSLMPIKPEVGRAHLISLSFIIIKSQGRESTTSPFSKTKTAWGRKSTHSLSFTHGKSRQVEHTLSFSYMKSQGKQWTYLRFTGVHEKLNQEKHIFLFCYCLWSLRQVRHILTFTNMKS